MVTEFGGLRTYLVERPMVAAWNLLRVSVGDIAAIAGIIGAADRVSAKLVKAGTVPVSQTAE